jgi:hypothetical protein
MKPQTRISRLDQYINEMNNRPAAMAMYWSDPSQTHHA